MTNALKFSLPGSNVFVGLTSTGEPHELDRQYVITVQDMGIGITDVQLEVLFTAFSRGNDAESKRKNPHGNGLGLYICKEIMTAMGG